jgi:hypothetical protein
MFVQVVDHNGNQVGIEASGVIKLREGGIADEPKQTVFVDYASGGTFAKGALDDIVRLFAPYIRMAALHAPDGVPVFLNADGIAAVEVDSQYDGNSVAVVNESFENVRVPARNKIALHETVVEAEQAIAAARRIA